MNTLILGDCASDGSLTLAKEILGQDIDGVEYSLLWDSKHNKKIIGWYLKMTKRQRGKIHSHDILSKANEYIQEKEMTMSWGNNLDHGLNITNMSRGGATAYGYYKRLLKYEVQHGRPELIILTDYDPVHPWQRINFDGDKYFLEKNYDHRKPDFMVNPALKSPPEVQRLAFNKAKSTYETQLNQKRNLRVMNWFHKYLEKEKYNFIKLKFYGGFEQFDKDPNVLDCSDLRKKYDRGFNRGTDTMVKIQVQSEIAIRVQEKLQQLTNGKIRI